MTFKVLIPTLPQIQGCSTEGVSLRPGQLVCKQSHISISPPVSFATASYIKSYKIISTHGGYYKMRTQGCHKLQVRQLQFHELVQGKSIATNEQSLVCRTAVTQGARQLKKCYSDLLLFQFIQNLNHFPLSHLREDSHFFQFHII